MKIEEKSGTGKMHMSGSGSAAWTTVREHIEKSWHWLLVALALTVAGSLVGFLLASVAGALVGLALGLLSFPASLRGAWHVRVIEHGGKR